MYCSYYMYYGQRDSCVITLNVFVLFVSVFSIWPLYHEAYFL